MKLEIMDYGKGSHEFRIIGETKFENDFIEKLNVTSVKSTKMADGRLEIHVDTQVIEE